MSNQKGYIAIITVIIITSVVVVAVSTAALLSIGEEQSAQALSTGEGALNIAESCMEQALLLIQGNPNYTGGSLTLPEGNCTITASHAGSTWTIQTLATDIPYTRTVMVTANRGTTITISQWVEQ